MKKIIIISSIAVAAAILGFFVGMPFVNNHLLQNEIDIFVNNNLKPKQISFNSTKFSSLPSAVKKYLQKNVVSTSNPPRYCQFSVIGKIRSDQNSGWMDFSSENFYSAVTSEFLKIKETQNFGFLWTKSLERYLNKKASVKSKFLSSIPIYDFAGSKLQRSYLVLYLLESVFCPTVLFPDMNIQWSGVGDTKALATIWNKDINGTALFHFNTNGEVVKIVTEDRYMKGELDYEREKFTIHFSNYQNVGKFNIPTYCEHQWNLASGDVTVGRFQISEIMYE